MDIIQVAIIGIAVAFNVLIIKIKLEKQRYFDAGLDAATLVLLSLLFAGSLGGLQVATVASAVVSVYLWFSPPKKIFNTPEIKKKDKIKL